MKTQEQCSHLASSGSCGGRNVCLQRSRSDFEHSFSPLESAPRAPSSGLQWEKEQRPRRSLAVIFLFSFSSSTSLSTGPPSLLTLPSNVLREEDEDFYNAIGRPGHSEYYPGFPFKSGQFASKTGSVMKTKRVSKSSLDVRKHYG